MPARLAKTPVSSPPAQATAAALGWGAAIGGLAVINIYRNLRHDGSALSCQVRRAFRTDTSAGQLAFVGFWTGLSAWFIPHICKRSTRVVNAEND